MDGARTPAAPAGAGARAAMCLKPGHAGTGIQGRATDKFFRAGANGIDFGPAAQTCQRAVHFIEQHARIAAGAVPGQNIPRRGVANLRFGLANFKPVAAIDRLKAVAQQSSIASRNHVGGGDQIWFQAGGRRRIRHRRQRPSGSQQKREKSQTDEAVTHWLFQFPYIPYR